MLKALLAFIPLLAGYLFVTRWHESRYQIRRQDSQGVYFYAAFTGIALILISGIAIQLLDTQLVEVRHELSVWVKESVPLEAGEQNAATAYWFMVLALTLFLGWSGGYLLNFIQALKTMKARDFALMLGQGVKDRRWNPSFYITRIYGYSSRRPLRRAVERMNADFELILLRALDQGSPVCFTLRGGKVYVGMVSGTVDPVDSRDMLRILPLMSGYRNVETMKVTFTTFYHKLYDRIGQTGHLSHLHPEKFEIAFCFSDVQSANLFDISAYLEFQKDVPQYRQRSFDFG